MRAPEQQQREAEQLEHARQAFAFWSGTRDEAVFQYSFLGHYDDRAAFGTELLAHLGADARLQRLPDWLRGYIRLDGEAVVRDFEAAGHFWIYEAPDSRAYVFDAYALPAPA